VREVERSAASVEEAIEAALSELGVSEQEADVEIVQDSQKGLLGLGSREATVRVRVRDGGVGPSAERDAEVATDFIRGLLERMELEADVHHHETDGLMWVDVLSGTDPDAMGLLIGRRGQTLDAVQEIMRAAVMRRTGEKTRIVLDIEDYRKRRRAQISEQAREAAERVKKGGKREKLEPMTAFERKIVHDAVAEVGGLESSSEGEDPQRRVVIEKKGR
jgi:spoIIIJ-associated protein